ncbi:DUF4232 domain-containing protein [Saccharopolyspora sp. WRP15-2]|uniref:DUF4232 domain-containing protein n=1 Tax=Saccharopolyspora oryzae TaxID=2997343 RepID=A0ABT4VA55_9PSEU|nr:DUF4232 domain-containing protein [Saccharopolyspora oryzae]MDA3630182.1 DUF4232 domain-containing protein [Saccharopolyspora oryzae]
MIRAKFLAITAATLAVGLTACSPGGSGQQSAQNNAQPIVQDSAGFSAAPLPSDQSGEAPESSAVQEEKPSGQEDAQPDTSAANNECKARDLQLSFGESDGAAGSVYQPLIFTNSSDRTCVMQGFPGVSYVGGDDGHQIGAPAFRVGKKGDVISLAPGGKASALIKFVTVENYDSGECRLEPAKGLRIYPPHDTASMFIPFDYGQNGCANPNMGDHNQLTVQTVQAGVAQ